MPAKKKSKKKEESTADDEFEQEIIGEEESTESQGISTAEQTNLSELPGVGPKTAEKLKEAGFQTVISIAVASPAELAAAAEIGNATAQKLIVAARQKAEFGFKPADLLYKQRLQVGKITTSSENLDGLIGGGVEAQAITEVFGEFRTGKTQIAHQLAVNVQLPKEKGGLNGGVIYIDTEGTFRPERIVQMATAIDEDPGKILSRIQVARVYNSDHQIFVTDKAQEIILENNVKLIVVDSVTSHFRAEYIGRQNLPTRQGKLNKHLHALQRMADIYSCAVFLTNQAMADPAAFFGDPTRAVGGHVLAHVPQTRLKLRKSKDDRRVAKLIDSPSLPEGECIFTIKAEGIRDP
ncbi:MAG: DNA repair and recombination protein RadA [Candidatus Helarchaeota archaeon]|nr:DNA repair and recombination protein RadA [Candidatus Helarchaeota archaeon]